MKAPKRPLLPPSEIIKRLMQTDDPFFLTTEEAAQFLRVTVRTIYNRIEKGKLFPGVRKVNDGYLIAAEDLRLIMGLRKSKAATTPTSPAEAPRRPGFATRW